MERNARGQRLCRVCREPLEKGQRAYCCRAHALEFGVRRSPELAGQLYRFRIGTWCVKCKADETVAREKWEQCRALLTGTPIEKLLLPFTPWQLDHVRPVADGGGGCDLDNLRLLCPRCHREITKEWYKARQARKREQGPWAAAARGKAEYKVEVPY